MRTPIFTTALWFSVNPWAELPGGYPSGSGAATNAGLAGGGSYGPWSRGVIETPAFHDRFRILACLAAYRDAANR